MKKILRTTLMLLALMASSVSFAQTTVTFTAGTEKGSQAQATAADEMTKDGITISATTGSFNNGQQFRFAKSSTATITSTVGNITKIVFTCTASGTTKYGPGCFVVPQDGTGTYSYEDKVGTWVGNAASVTLTASSNQVRATTIEVTYAPGGSTPSVSVEAPTITGETPFADKTTVTISVPDGTTVYYTTDGSTPTNQGDDYTAPFEISETTTVKAIAYDKAGNKSSVVTKQFAKLVGATIASLNEATANINNVNLTLNGAKVVYVNGTNIHVREGDKALLFYNTGLSLSQNETINGSVIVDYQYYYGIPEVKKNNSTDASNLTITAGSDQTSLDATTATLAEIKALSHVADLVKIEGVSIVASGNNQYATNGTDSVQLYKNVATIDSYVGDGKTHTIYALFNNIYKKAPEVSVVAVDVTTGINSTPIIVDDASAPAYNLGGQRVSNAYKGIVVKKGKKFIRK